MTRRDENSLNDILDSIDAIKAYLERGILSDLIIFDAVRARIIDIGEAVRNVKESLLEIEPEIPWRQIRDMRNHLTHAYFDINENVIAEVVNVHLDPLRRAVVRLLTENI